MNIYFGYLGNEKNKISHNWLNNVRDWLGSKSELKIDTNDENFFCLKLDISLSNGLQSAKLTTSYIDGNIMYGSKIYNNNNLYNELSNLKSFIGQGNCHGRYTFLSYENKILKVFNDYYGVNPFFYYVDSNKNFYFSNDIRILLLCDNVHFELNISKCKLLCTENYIISDNFITDTFYKGIKKLPEGSFLRYFNKKISISKIFKPNLFKKNDYYFFDNKEDYYKLFRKELNKLIESYVKSSDTAYIGVSLSGGIDSSVILASLIDLGYKDKIICYHGTSNNPLYYTCNDSEIVKKLTKQLNVKCKIIYINNGNSICNAVLGRDFIRNIDGPCCIGNESFGYKLEAELEKDGVKLIFGGDGGDYMFTGTRYCKDMLRYNHLVDIESEIDKIMNEKTYNKFIYKHAQFLPLINNYFYKKTLWLSDSNTKLKYPTFFTKAMFSLNRKHKDANQYKYSKKLKFWSRRFIYDFMFPKGANEDDKSDGVEFIHPLLDKIIYDLCQKIPPYIHYDITKGNLGDYIVQKRVLREAYKDILPDYITNQKDKTNYAPSLILKFRREKENILENILNNDELYLEKYCIVDKKKFKSKLRVFLNNIDDPHFVPNLETKYIFTLVYLEIWLKEISKGRMWMLNQCKIQSKVQKPVDIEVVNG